MSVSGGKSKISNSASGSQSMKSFISPDQLPFLKRLWGEGTAGILDQGIGAADTAGGAAFMGGLYQNPFAQQLGQFAQPNNEMAQANIGLLGQNLNQNLQRNLLPGITDTSIQSGGLGGGRQGIAQGLALQGTQQAFAQGSQDILNNAYNQANQATQFGTNWATNNAMQGITGLGMLQQQQFAPLLALAQILGNPTVLQESTGKNKSSGSSNSWNMGFGAAG